MTTQVTFKTDDNIKKDALKKAKRDGITLKAFLTYCLRSYIRWDLELWIKSNIKIEWFEWIEWSEEFIGSPLYKKWEKILSSL